ncbi:MAG: VCBS repeat-containing protein [Gemmatimonadaceae bacterium]|nr:VCBS repeat-containing protein [Gemmatimonadaceae bacterium]
MMRGRLLLAARSAALLLALAACGGESGSGVETPRQGAAADGGTPAGPPLFERLGAEATGIAFSNDLPESPEFNILNYLYYFNGGGVAVGDVNGDSLPDLYFSSNVGSNRLYVNKGNFRFEDVTTAAGVAGPSGWKSGVTMADVDGDGRLDIYVSAVSYLTMQGRNMLYINNGDGTFTDRAKALGVDHAGYSTQSAFFDYDADGDLDLFLLSHSTHTERGIGNSTRRDVRNARAGGRLFRNDGARFSDVSAQAGIFGGIEGYGLGVVVSDLDQDGCPDVYVANDFQEQDFLYRNTCRRTFTESIAKATGHTSRFSMGVDAADVNNDALPDLVVGDMLPEREEILKTSASSEAYSLFRLRVNAGYHPQFARNTLQLNRGDGEFSEVGFLAGVAATDWTWSLLFADLDNDGRKDLFVTSGIFRRPNDLDYINYIGNETVQASLARGVTRENLPLLRQMPTVPVINHAYRNDGNLQFTDVATAWGLARPGYSNGAAYVDLDNDGALDLVVNNYDAPASVYRNRARERAGNHWLTVALRGAGRNTAGIGAKVYAWQQGVPQFLEQSPTRGFQSSVDQRLHFGLGGNATIDSLVVIWPDGRFQVQARGAGDRLLVLDQANAAGRWDYAARRRAAPLFADVSDSLRTGYVHVENDFNDMDREPLMPHLLSTQGPALAVGDLNGDGLDDMYVGGAKWQPGKLLVQQASGGFVSVDSVMFAGDSLAEDVDAAFTDVNGDGKLDLFVVSGGNEAFGSNESLRNRLYLNDGTGHFAKSVDGLPMLFENGSCVVPGDFNGDGHMDLFVGTRVVARQYGVSPKSHLLQGDGKGKFSDVTAALAPGLLQAGMVTSGAWLDYDRDGKLDLIVAGEWMPVRVYHQEQGTLVERTREAGLAGSEGWWNSITAADINGDGRTDLVLGNLGLNTYLRASATEPAQMYVFDFFGNGTIEQVISFYKHGTAYPLATRDELTKLMPQLRAKYTSYRAFGASTVPQILPADELAKATVLVARTFASSVAIANADGRFALQPLPVEAQFAPVYAAVARDLDGDGRVDLLLGGNFMGHPPMIGQSDASYGLLLHGSGTGTFSALDMARSGVRIRGEVRHMAPLRTASGRTIIVVARNNDRLTFIRARP